MDQHKSWHWTYESAGRTLRDVMTTQIRRRPKLNELLAGVAHPRPATHASWSDTAQLVAEELRRRLPGPDVLTAEQRLGSPDGYASHTLHVEPDGSFSIIAVVWRPGQLTRIHDHVTWYVVGIIQASSTRNCSTPTSAWSVAATTTSAT